MTKPMKPIGSCAAAARRDKRPAQERVQQKDKADEKSGLIDPGPEPRRPRAITHHRV